MGLKIIKPLFSLDAQELTEINYLDRAPPPSDSAVLFAEGLVSKKGRWDEKVTFSADGKEVFWGIHPHQKDYFRPYVMHARFVDGTWSEPDTFVYAKIPPVNSTLAGALPCCWLR